MKKNQLVESTTEVEIQYETPYSKGVMIIDTNFYQKNHKKIMKKLKDCNITTMIERRKAA